MRRVIHFARRNKFLILATALLMVGAGCVGAAREAGEQLTEDAMKPITVPVEVYQRATDVASSTEARAREMIDQAGGINQ